MALPIPNERRTVLCLQAENPALVDFIHQTIRVTGPVSFAWFMEQALYHPEHGYYTSGKATIGRRGDYFTNVSVGPLFGKLLAIQFAEIWTQLGKPSDFVVVEQGAHDGQLARDVLESLKSISPEFFNSVHYRIIEPFPGLSERQSDTLAKFRERVDWCQSLDALEPFRGIHFSNELLDAMPVHLVCRQPRDETQAASGQVEWFEKYVALDGDNLVFIQRPIADSKLEQHLTALPSLPAGYETEINLAALDWIDRISDKLQSGFLIAVDYGFVRRDFYAEHRRTGTLQSRMNHRVLDSSLDHIGYADIAAHVEWTSLADRAERRCLNIAGFADQHHFLTGIISEHPSITTEADPRTRRALQTLLHPEMLGRSFQVLALSKGVRPDIALSGFRFTREPRAALGL